MAGGDCVSGYILCQTERAEAPYFIENISMNIYSLEELCYYLDHNLYLIDQTILNEGLCNWIQEELKLPALAAKLRPKMGKFASVEDLVYPVFKEINYLTYEELKVLNTRLQKFDKETPAMREKCKGDALMENKMYVHAIQVYQKLLDRKDLEEIREGLTECIYHNLGCAYSYLFQMDKAIECFRRAYEGGRSTEALETYLTAFSMSYSEEEYKNMAKTLGVEEEILTAVQNRKKEFSQIPREKVNSQNMDDILNHLTSECSKLAIANVELSKQNATQAKTIMELTGEVRVLNSKILLNESISDDLQKKLNRKYPRKPYNKKLYRK